MWQLIVAFLSPNSDSLRSIILSCWKRGDAFRFDVTFQFYCSFSVLVRFNAGVSRAVLSSFVPWSDPWSYEPSPSLLSIDRWGSHLDVSASRLRLLLLLLDEHLAGVALLLVVGAKNQRKVILKWEVQQGARHQSCYNRQA